MNTTRLGMSDTDRPPTPSPRLPEHYTDRDLRFHENGTPCEWGESYRPSGLHPVQIGDILNDRYEILCKLGYGSSATVWLAADSRQRTFVAIKIHKARASQSARSELSLYELLANAKTDAEVSNAGYLVGLLTSFELTGPNGQHTCCVFEVMGPNLFDLLHSTEYMVGHPLDDNFCHRLPKDLTKRILKAMLHGLRFLHSNRVVHGDVHKGNILMRIRLPEYDFMEELRQSEDQESPLERIDGKKDLWAPPNLLRSADLRSYISSELHPVAKITDIGGAFRFGEVPEKINTPDPLRAPETVLRLSTVGAGVDIWSFGCLAFELVTGSDLFIVNHMFVLGGCETLDDGHLIQMTEVIGPLPEELFRAWRRGSCYFDTSSKRIYGAEDEGSLDDDLPSDSEIPDSEDGVSESDGESTFSDEDAPTSNAEDALASMRLSEPLEENFWRKKPKDIDEIEGKQILHLLRWILQYDPAKRPSAEEILKHEWFQT